MIWYGLGWDVMCLLLVESRQRKLRANYRVLEFSWLSWVDPVHLWSHFIFRLPIISIFLWHPVNSHLSRSLCPSHDCRCFNLVVKFIKSFLLMNLVNEPKFFTFHPDLKTLNCFNVIPYDQEIINKPKSKLKDEVPHFSTNLQITNIVMPFKLWMMVLLFFIKYNFTDRDILTLQVDPY